MNVILVKAAWDADARVWWTESSDLHGLNAEADSLEALAEKLPGIAVDLIEAGGGVLSPNSVIEVVAHASARVPALA